MSETNDLNDHIFRDRSDGAAARRMDLLRKRRDELITMPHAVRRVFVQRSARIAASLVVLVGGYIMLLVASVPTVSAALEKVLPGINPAALSQVMLGTWVLAIFAYAMARSRAEHTFIVGMSKYVLPSEDVDNDIERLSHEHPDAMAKSLAQKLEVRSAALPVIAAALLLPATAVYAMESVRERGWSRLFEYRLVDRHWWLVALAIIALGLGFMMTRAWARAPIVARIAGLVAFGSTLAVPVLALRMGQAPAIWMLAIPLVAIAIAVVVRRLRIERALIDASDMNAGTEVFSLKKLLKSMKDTVVTVKSKITRPMVIGAVVAGGVFYFFGGSGASMYGETATVSTPVKAIANAGKKSSSNVAKPIVADGDMMEVESRQAAFAVDTVDGFGTLNGIAGLDRLPTGWKMTLVVRLAESTPEYLQVRPLFGGRAQPFVAKQAGAIVSIIEVQACDAPEPLGLRLDPQNSPMLGNTQVKLNLEPRLIYEPCAKTNSIVY